MNKPVLVPQENELERFIHFLYEGLEGYAYMVAKEPNDPEDWDQAFFEYPGQVPQMVQAAKTLKNKKEIYIAPALFHTNTNAKKENFKATNVLWADFDGNAPHDFNMPPSLSIRSSEPGHEHCYWKLSSPLYSVAEVEEYNRRICFQYQADNSGWDAVQVLRPPFTTNHKRGGLSVATLNEEAGLTYSLAVFDDLAPAPQTNVDFSLWEKVDLPSVNAVIYRNKFGPDFETLFEKTKQEVMDRSASLQQMAYICAEAGLTDKEIYAIISHLANRWEKFSHHTSDSRARQLISIIEHARIKYPHSSFGDIATVFEYSPKTLFEADIKVDWAIEGMLMDRGKLILAGPGGIGKTQLSLQFMFHLAAGRNFLHYKIPTAMPVGFFSLEMGDYELKNFMNTMYPILQETFTKEELDRMNENMMILPFGEALPLNTSMGQDIVVEYQERFNWRGIFFDSVGSTVIGNLNSQETVQGLTNFNDKLVNRYGCFTWFIHHMRKAPPGTSNFGGSDDFYGDVYLTNRASSAYSITKTKKGEIRIKNTKQRHAPEEPNYLLERTKGYTFNYLGKEPENTTTVIEGSKKEPPPEMPSPFK